MNTQEKRIVVFIGGVALFVTLVIGIISGLPDGKLHTTFCDVGQGDGIYIRMPDGKNVVIDGGPNSKILSCLGRGMAFWDRDIELIILTHPHEDHFKGLLEILKRYNVNNIIVPAVGNEDSDLYTTFVQLVQRENISVKNLYQGEKVEFNFKSPKPSNNSEVAFTSLWPTEDWVAERVDQVLKPTEFAVKTTHNDLNDFSQVLHMSYGSFDILFTGDSESSILNQVKDLIPQNSIEVIKVPHQGNKHALTEDLVSHIKPKLGVIMVGKNSFGHPSPQTIQLLSDHKSVVKRTDHDGDVEIVSDGEKWWVKD